jgi:hypothetical protein
MKIEDFEYSPKAAADSAARTVDPKAAARLAQARAESQRLARQISADERARTQSLETEADVAKALLKLQAVTGVKVGIERKRGKQR